MIDMAGYKERLDAERGRLLEELKRLDAEVAESADPLDPQRGGIGNHLADVADETFEEEKSVSLRRNEEQILTQVDRALQRIAEGSYGTCENCGRPIPAERLEARPFATLCIACRQRLEGQR